jgi:general secretion pathway protein F
MQTFEYRGYNTKGAARSGLIEATGPKEARELLAKRGIFAEKLKQSRSGIKIRTEDRATIYRELNSLLSAGVPLARALDLLIESQDKAHICSVLASTRDKVKNGESFASSFSGATVSVSSFEGAILEAAETSATVGPTLLRLADFLEEQSRISERVQTALIYPAIVVGAGICVSLFMLGFLVPKVRGLFQNGSRSLPPLTEAVIAAGDFLLAWGLPIAVLLAASIWVLRRRIIANRSLRCRLDGRIFHLPILGKAYRILVNLRFSQTMATLLNSGVPLIEAFKLAARATGSPFVENSSGKEAESISHGGSLSSAVAAIEPLSESLPGLLRVGESSGSVVEMLDSAGARYSIAWQRFIDRSLSLLEPVLMLVIGAFVLLVTVSVLLPVISLTDTLRI